MLLEQTPPAPRPIAVVPIGEATILPALQLADELRQAGHHVEFGLRGKVGQRLKRAAQQNARYAILLGEDEIVQGTVVLRDLDRGEQHTLARADLAGALSG
jgi:histidyl-tRNA synthetase